MGYESAPLGLGFWDYWRVVRDARIDGFQVHHIIPRSLKDHTVLREIGFNIDAFRNLIYLPTDRSFHPTRSIHNGWNSWHRIYNEGVREKLNAIRDLLLEERQQAVDNLLRELKDGVRKGTTRLVCPKRG